MIKKETIIHIDWEGSVELDTAKTLRGATDYGVYQIYGGHPIYGNSALLYIGRAVNQRFGVRVQQEEGWTYNYSHLPPYNKRRPPNAVRLEAPRPDSRPTQTDLALRESELQYVHVLNWGCHRDLLPEVSGARWTSRFDEFPTVHFREDGE